MARHRCLLVLGRGHFVTTASGTGNYNGSFEAEQGFPPKTDLHVVAHRAPRQFTELRVDLRTWESALVLGKWSFVLSSCSSGYRKEGFRSQSAGCGTDPVSEQCEGQLKYTAQSRGPGTWVLHLQFLIWQTLSRPPPQKQELCLLAQRFLRTPRVEPFTVTHLRKGSPAPVLQRASDASSHGFTRSRSPLEVCVLFIALRFRFPQAECNHRLYVCLYTAGDLAESLGTK